MMTDSLRIAVISNNTDNNLAFVTELAEIIAKETTKIVQVLYTWNKYPYFNNIPLPADKIADMNVIRPKLVLSKCIYCAQCAKNCKYNAIKFNKLERIAKIDYYQCMSCNICMKLCKKEALAAHSILIGKKYYHERNGVRYIGGIATNDNFYYPDYIFKSIEKDIVPGQITIIPLYNSADFYVDEVLRETDFILSMDPEMDLKEFELDIDFEKNIIRHQYLDIQKEIPFLPIKKYSTNELVTYVLKKMK